jgi:hypothetical protein
VRGPPLAPFLRGDPDRRVLATLETFAPGLAGRLIVEERILQRAWVRLPVLLLAGAVVGGLIGWRWLGR